MRPKVNRYKNRRGVFSLALIPLLLTACSLHPERGLKSCHYRFQGFAFTGMDAQASHWRVDMGVANPNGKEVVLSRMHYALLYQGDTLVSGWNPERKTVPPRDSQVVTASLDLPHAAFRRLPAGIWSQSDARFLVVADAYLHTWVGDFMVSRAVVDTVHINMPEQVAKYRDILMRQFFKWPGNHLEDGGIPRPNENPPGTEAPSDGSAPDPSHPADEHL